MSARDLSELSMADLFRLDAEGQLQTLSAGLLALERDASAAGPLEACMRAAHSLKGAARIAEVDAAARVAHVMEDCLVAAQRGTPVLGRPHIDALLQAADLLGRIAGTADAAMTQWSGTANADVDAVLALLTAALDDRAVPTTAPPAPPAPTTAPPPAGAPAAPPAEARSVPQVTDQEGGERVLRVTANNLNRLLGLAAESMVESRWLKPFSDLLMSIKRLHDQVDKTLDGLGAALAARGRDERSDAAFAAVRQDLHQCRELLAQRLLELEMFDGRSTNLAHRLYDAALACRMRPFSAGVKQFTRVVRDLGRSLGKQVRLEIIGAGTQVDRDILEKLDAPLGHLLRNAVDHGIESPEERLIVGKAAEGVIRLEARHSAGLLQITAADDGRGIDLDRLREIIVERQLTSTDIAQRLGEAELLEFLFLPGFTTKDTVTGISGRGVGLDVVHDMVKQVRGNIRIFSEFGVGTRFQLQLPLTLSVVRTLLVEIGGEPYAFPLAHVVRTLKVPKQDVRMLEGREHFLFNGRPVGLVAAQQILGGNVAVLGGEELPVVLIGDPANPYALVTDRFLGERELVVQTLDPRLGKVKDIAAAALMEDGSPALIVDIEDMLRSVDKLVAAGRLNKLEGGTDRDNPARRKSVLVVEDSLTVRELERKILDHAGYQVEVAVDGMDGWNVARAGHFDLIITDVDMPRLDGIELTKLIRRDPLLKSLPVLIVSYKDREEDRHRGLEAGADYYTTKGSFHDDTFLRAVVDLIGTAEA